MIAPGDIMHAVYDQGDRSGQAIVLATFRHKHTLSEEEGREILTARRDHLVDHRGMRIEWKVDTWRRVLATDEDVYDSYPGDWHTNGTGKSWVKVLIGFEEFDG